MTPAISFATALRDPELLGGPFRGESFRAWHTLAKVVSGEPLDATDAALFRRCTGRRRLPSGPVSRLFLVIGRRGGKSRWLSALGLWAAALAYDWRAHVSPGEVIVVSLVGADRKQALLLSKYALGLARSSPMISAQIVREAEGRIEFANGGALETMTNDDRLIRGRSMAALIGDEAAFWRSDDLGASSDEEVWAAAVPSLATAPGGGWAVLSSSPSRPKGLLHRKWKQLHSQNAGNEIAWQAPSRVMNPTLPASTVHKAMAEDPIRAKAEFEAQWRQPGDDFAPLDVVLACTDKGVKDRPPLPDIQYVAFTDGAGGTGKDSWVTALAHRESDGLVILDKILERRPRFVPAQVCAEHAAVLRLYGVSEVCGDAYSAAWIRDEFARNSVTYLPSRKNKSQIFLAALPALLAGRARLLDSSRLREQLTGLQRTVHAQGRESIEGSGASLDDVANAACGAIGLAAAAESFPDFVLPVGPEVFTRRSGYMHGYDDDFDSELTLGCAF